MTAQFTPIPEAIQRIRKGQMVIVVDDPSRENEGDFVLAAEKVTPSCSNSVQSDSPSRRGPGNTSFAPTNGAENGKPQALTWNIGTTGAMTSLADRQNASGNTEA